MTTYLLDTNAWIAYLRRNNADLVARLSREPPLNIALCSIVLGELYYGAERGGPIFQAKNVSLIESIRKRFVSLPFDDAAAAEYGRVRAMLATRGNSIGPNDLLIASIALANGLTLVTNNTREFSRVPGLNMEDWQAP